MKNTVKTVLGSLALVTLLAGCASPKVGGVANYSECPRIDNDAPRFNVVNNDVLGEKVVEHYTTKEVPMTKNTEFVYYKDGAFVTNVYQVPVNQLVTITNTYKTPIVKSRTTTWEDGNGRTITVRY